MTKEELERIKEAYYSGLKVQIWFDGYWENFDARDYSMYSDPFSENRQYRIVGSAYADIAEKRIKELEEENAELKKQVEQKQHLADVRLEQSLESYKLFSDERKARIDVDIALDDTTDQLTYAKTIIQDLLENTDEYARQRAEDFLNKGGE